MNEWLFGFHRSLAVVVARIRREKSHAFALAAAKACASASRESSPSNKGSQGGTPKGIGSAFWGAPPSPPPSPGGSAGCLQVRKKSSSRHRFGEDSYERKSGTYAVSASVDHRPSALHAFAAARRRSLQQGSTPSTTQPPGAPLSRTTPQQSPPPPPERTGFRGLSSRDDIIVEPSVVTRPPRPPALDDALLDEGASLFRKSSARPVRHPGAAASSEVMASPSQRTGGRVPSSAAQASSSSSEAARARDELPPPPPAIETPAAGKYVPPHLRRGPTPSIVVVVEVPRSRSQSLEVEEDGFEETGDDCDFCDDGGGWIEVSSSSTTCDPSSVAARWRSGSRCERGHRSYNEDACVERARLLQRDDETSNDGQPPPCCAFFGVYDGHSGADAAARCENELHERFRDALLTPEDSDEAPSEGLAGLLTGERSRGPSHRYEEPEAALTRAFEALDASYCAAAACGEASLDAGATARGRQRWNSTF